MYAASRRTQAAEKFANGASTAQKIHGPGHVFKTPDDAAVDLLRYAARESQSDPANKILERGGDIIPVDGGYTYNDVQVGLTGMVKIDVRMDAVAWVHTHPSANRRNPYTCALDAANVRLSNPGDVQQATALNKALGRQIPAYVGASDGSIRRFDLGAYRRRGVILYPKGDLQFRRTGKK